MRSLIINQVQFLFVKLKNATGERTKRITTMIILGVVPINTIHIDNSILTTAVKCFFFVSPARINAAAMYQIINCFIFFHDFLLVAVEGLLLGIAGKESTAGCSHTKTYSGEIMIFHDI